MKRKQTVTTFLFGMLMGGVLFGGGAAVAAGIVATPTSFPIRLDGKEIQLTAYNILGNNYVKLRDIGQAVDFNVYWDSAQRCVQVDSKAAYTGTNPSTAQIATTPTTPTPESKPESAASTVDVEAARQEIAELTNQLRADNGIAALRVDDKLMQAAQVRAEEMAATGTYSHTRPDGRYFNTVTDANNMAENIHCITKLYLEQQKRYLPNAAVMLWTNSAGHLKNMKNAKLSSIGVGIAEGVDENGLDCYYCVQLFVYDGYTVSWVDNPILQAK